MTAKPHPWHHLYKKDPEQKKQEQADRDYQAIKKMKLINIKSNVSK